MNFQVTVLPSERSFDVHEDETILQAAIRQGVGLPYGCKDGACGTCKCKKLEGQVFHGVYQEKALSPTELEQGYILPCRAVPQSPVILEARSVVGADAFPILKLPSRVAAVEKPTADVAVLKLQLPANNTFGYRAGQYIEIILRDNSRRCYSMASAPLETNSTLELHIRHLPGGKFTDQVFSSLKEKDILRLEGPFGTFFLREDSDKPMVLLASGTGFAPIKAIIEQMQAKGLTRPMTLYWGCRSKADLYLHEWALAAAAAIPNLTYIPVLSDPQAEDSWAGRQGFVHHAVMQDMPDLSAYEVYACGVPIMVESARRDFIAQCGLAEEAFFADAFTSEADKNKLL